jgi:hypothetical protein
MSEAQIVMLQHQAAALQRERCSFWKCNHNVKEAHIVMLQHQAAAMHSEQCSSWKCNLVTLKSKH